MELASAVLQLHGEGRLCSVLNLKSWIVPCGCQGWLSHRGHTLLPFLKDPRCASFPPPPPLTAFRADLAAAARAVPQWDWAVPALIHFLPKVEMGCWTPWKVKACLGCAAGLEGTAASSVCPFPGAPITTPTCFFTAAAGISITRVKSGKVGSKQNLIRRYGMNTYFPKCIVTVHRRRWEKIDGTEMLMKIMFPFSVCSKEMWIPWCGAWSQGLAQSFQALSPNSLFFWISKIVIDE